jgi:hypothetical protein
MLVFSQIPKATKDEMIANNRVSGGVTFRGSDAIYHAADVVAVSCRHNGKGVGGVPDNRFFNVACIQTDKWRELGGSQSYIQLQYDAQFGRLLDKEP